MSSWQKRDTEKSGKAEAQEVLRELKKEPDDKKNQVKNELDAMTREDKGKP